MKTKLLLVAMAAAVAFTSCDRNNDDNNNTTPGTTTAPTATLSMKMNGTNWVAEKNTSASLAFRSNDGQTDGAIIKGATNSGENFQITSDKEINGPGTYNLPSSGGGGITYTGNSKSYVVSTAGGPATLNITEIKMIGSSKYIKGTFQGTLRNLTDNSDTIVITEGVFNGIDP